jgi:predicted dehydrogenase
MDDPRITLSGVADLRGDRAEEVAARLGADAYTDTERMLKEQSPDLVVIATPDALHKEPVLNAVAAGVPYVIMEKPLATSVEEAELLVDAAEKAKTRLYINYANRGSPLDRATYYVTRQKLLGELVYGEMHLDDNILVPVMLWGGRSPDWIAGTSSAHFLMSHQVDLLRWLMAPAEISEVYAIAQNRVLTNTPDLYDAFLVFDSGFKARIKAEWIKQTESLVEFTISMTGSLGGVTYRKLPGFGETPGWRAVLDYDVSATDLLRYQEELRIRGIHVKTLFHRPAVNIELEKGGGRLRPCLESFVPSTDQWTLARSLLDAMLEDTPTPSSWKDYGAVPTGEDGLKQTRVVCAIVESAETGRVVEVKYP